MDKLNQLWQDLLITKKFTMSVATQSDQLVYRGRFALTNCHTIDFAVSLSKSDTKSLGQIVFHKIAYSKKTDKDTNELLSYLNQLNQHQSIYYYFVLGDDGYVFMRHMTEVTPATMEGFFNILLQGPTLIKNLMPEIEERFGPFVIL